MKKEIVEGNKLIAEFMGVYPEEKNNTYWYHGVDLRSAGLPFFLGIMGNGTNEPPFHSSWDWLMPVVEKIESFEYDVTIDSFPNCIIFNKDSSDEIVNVHNMGTKINTVHLAVVRFIEWYNQNK